jgi:hypothetical protein
MKSKYNKRTALHILKKMYLSNGYLRVPDAAKLETDGSQKYKKGYEIRFIINNKKELKSLQTAISSLGYTVSKTFIKNGQNVQPLYGKEITLQFRKFRKLKKSSKKG